MLEVFFFFYYNRQYNKNQQVYEFATSLVWGGMMI